MFTTQLPYGLHALPLSQLSIIQLVSDAAPLCNSKVVSESSQPLMIRMPTTNYHRSNREQSIRRSQPRNRVTKRPTTNVSKALVGLSITTNASASPRLPHIPLIPAGLVHLSDKRLRLAPCAALARLHYRKQRAVHILGHVLGIAAHVHVCALR